MLLKYLIIILTQSLHVNLRLISSWPKYSRDIVSQGHKGDRNDNNSIAYEYNYSPMSHNTVANLIVSFHFLPHSCFIYLS